MKRLIIVLCLLLVAFLCLPAEAATKIAEVNPVTKWSVKSQGNGFEYLSFEFEPIDSIRTRVSMSMNLDIGLNKGQIISLIAQTEADTEQIPLVKQVGNGVSINRVHFGLGNMGNEEFIITHPSIFEDGWEVKIGTASATVATSTSTDAIRASTDRNVHFGNSRYWAAFHNGTSPVLYQSSDGATWAIVTTGNTDDHIFTTPDPAVGAWTARWVGSDVYFFGGTSTSSYFEHYTLNSDGTVTKDTTRDETIIDYGDNEPPEGVIDFDGNMHTASWLGAGSVTAQRHTKSNSDFSTWTLQGTTTAAGEYNHGHTLFDIGNVTDGADVLHVGVGGITLQEKYWDESGSAFSTMVDFAGGDENKLIHSYVQTSDGKVHVVWIANASDSGTTHTGSDVSDTRMGHRERGADPTDGWTTVSTDVTGLTSATKITLAPDGTNLWIIYDKGDEKLYYRKWDTSSWGDEVALKAGTDAIQGAVSSYELSGNNEIGVIWLQDTGGAGSPFDVMFEVISVGAAPAPSIIPKIEWVN